MEWFVNDTPADRISLNDRGLAYGDGLFETIAVRDGAERLLGQHIARLQVGAVRLGMPEPAAAEVQRVSAAARSGRRRGTLKLIYTRGTGPRGYAPPSLPRPMLAAGFSASVATPVGSEGMVVRLCETPTAVTPAVAGLKTLARVEQVLARAEWTDPETREGLMFDPDGNLVCGTMSNVFLVTANGLLTPRLDRAGVAGVMRAHLIELAAAAGIPVVEERISRDDLLAADDVFLTNSQLGLMPVARIGSHAFARAELTLRLRALLAESGIEECAP